jgi:hypothetical protein
LLFFFCGRLCRKSGSGRAGAHLRRVARSKSQEHTRTEQAPYFDDRDERIRRIPHTRFDFEFFYAFSSAIFFESGGARKIDESSKSTLSHKPNDQASLETPVLSFHRRQG